MVIAVALRLVLFFSRFQKAVEPIGNMWIVSISSGVAAPRGCCLGSEALKAEKGPG